VNCYMSLAIGEDDRAAGFKLLARQIHVSFMSRIKDSEGRVGLPPFESIDATIRNRVLDPNEGVPFEIRAALRSRLGLPAEEAPPATAPGTNAPPAASAPSA